MMDGEQAAVADVSADTGAVEEVSTDVAAGGDVATEEPAETDIATPEETPPDDAAGDGRALPRDIQRALKTMRENPEMAKAARSLNDSYFREQAFTKIFPKPADAMAAKSTLDLIGGSEGIAQMQAQAETWRQIDEDIAEGRPEFLDDIIKTSPEGFKKLVPQVLNKLYALDKAAYGDAVAPVLENTLRGYRVLGPDGKVDPAAFSQLMADLQETIKQSKNVAEDPKAKQLSEREKALNDREHKTFLDGLGRVSNDFMSTQITKHIAPLLTSMASVKNDKAGFVAEVNSQISTLLTQDAQYQTNVKALLREKNAEKTTRYINAKLEEAVPKAVTAVRNTWMKRYGSVKPKATTPTNGASPSGPLSKEPDYKTLDNVAGKAILFMSGKGYIKGKLVTWKK